MPAKELNSGIIFTNPNCIGCNKCISGCIAVGANVVIKDEKLDRYAVLVDPNKCILCGTCVESCVHHARTYRDDTYDFFEALERGEEISILVSPTLLTDYEKQYHNILGYLKQLGVKHIYNTGFGGDLMIWVYMNLIKDFGLQGVISQFCPVIVNYLETYKPELLQYLMPVQSPVMCTAIYVNDYIGNKDKLAYISPCIAGKFEVEDVNTYGRVAYNVTFERLMKCIEHIDISEFYAEDEVGYGLGALIPMSGGLSDNIKRYIGFNEVLIQTAGPPNIFPYFDHYYKEVTANEELPFLVDALSCTHGCNFGTGTLCGVELRNEMTFSAHRVKEQAYASGNVSTALNYEARLKKINEQFKDFELSSFVRQYDSTRQVVKKSPDKDSIDEIYASMYKLTPAQRHTDCGACGYKTCYDMACAIATNVNHKENCINYSKECIRLETEKINKLVDEISNMNEELKKSTQLKSNFLANMSHEIRTPMNAIIGMAEMALRGEIPIEERGYIQQIKASGRSLLAIINDILDFSKIESGKMELNEGEYAVMSIINDTINIVMTRIAEKNISLVVNVEPDIPFKLYGDDIRIKQILVNLANNAVKFTEKGCVEISMSHENLGDTIILKISVRDTGIGIKQEDVEKLFTSFQQVDSKRNRNVEGTGLGLAISREFVRLMDGTIDIESVYGEGSTFSFKIPQRIVDASPSIRVKSDKVIKTACYIDNFYVRESFFKAIASLEKIQNVDCYSLDELQTAIDDGLQFVFIDYPLWTDEITALYEENPTVQMVVIVDPRKDFIVSNNVRKINQPAYCLSVAAIINNEQVDNYDHEAHEKLIRFVAPNAEILIVDDNAINLTVAKGLLSPFKMKITTALSAREALKLLEDKKYDIVFMDHMMPEIDGIDATHMIREKDDPYYKELTIIALTANAINDAKEMFLQEGMNDFVAKPIEMADITAKLRKWLPSDKVEYLSQTDSMAKSDEASKEEKLKIKDIDVHAGIALAGTMTLYRAVLCDYYKVIAKKADLIERYAADEDIEAYTIEVHALKSASKLIGAVKLSDMAARLEKCGNEKNISIIKEETGSLLELYRSYIPILEPYCKIEEEEIEKVDIVNEVLSDKLLDLSTALDDFDIDLATEIIKDLQGYNLDDKGMETLDNLIEAVESMEYDDAVEIATEWSNSL